MKINNYKILEKINDSSDLKELSVDELYTLSNELTDYLLCIYNYGLLKKNVNCCPVGKNIFYVHCERE